jgi:hypothetical protein
MDAVEGLVEILQANSVMLIILIVSEFVVHYVIPVLLTYLLTPWSRVLLEKLTSELCS